MQIKELMSRNLVSLLPSNTILEAAQIMKATDVGFLVILNEYDKLVGVLTDRDIVLKLAAKKSLSSDIDSVMKRNVITIHENKTVSDATDLMGNMQVRRLVVVDDFKNPVGVVSLSDIAKEVLTEEYAFEALCEICYDFRQKNPQKEFRSEIHPI